MIYQNEKKEYRMLPVNMEQMMEDYYKKAPNETKQEKSETIEQKFTFKSSIYPPPIEPIFSDTRVNIFIVVSAFFTNLALTYLTNDFIHFSLLNIIAISFILWMLKSITFLGYFEGLYAKEKRDRMNTPIKRSPEEMKCWKN